jgi:hypothetical protein
MEETMRETVNFEFIRCIFNSVTSIVDKKTNKQSDWKTDRLKIREEINLVKHMNNNEFDEYCKTIEKS